MRGLLAVVCLLVGCGSSGGGGGSWSEQTVPAPSSLSAYTLWVAGENDVWLGGTQIWHFDGTAWTERAPMSVVHFWGFAPNDIWAISESRVYRWSGTAWTEVLPTTGVVFESLWRIWGASSTDIYIANQDNSRVYHYDGSIWTRTTLQFVMVDALWGSGPNDIWLSGTGDLYHYTGTWTEYAGNDAPPSVNSFWGFGPNDVWAAGTFDALSHWNGSAWTPVADEEVDESFNGIWGSAPNDIWAVGDNGMVAHFDGSSWSVSRELDIRASFSMVHGSSRTNVWATAVDLSAQKALVLRYEP